MLSWSVSIPLSDGDSADLSCYQDNQNTEPIVYTHNNIIHLFEINLCLISFQSHVPKTHWDMGVWEVGGDVRV